MSPPPAVPVDERRSVELVSALAELWSSIRAKHPEVPPVVVVAAPAAQKGVLGHFAPLRWAAKLPEAATGERPQTWHEVVVVAEYLARDAADVAETLLHEAGHALNFARGIKDCSRSQYHNRRFAAAAGELGLHVERVPHYGFASTSLRPITRTQYLREIKRLDSVLIHRRSGWVMPLAPTGQDNDTDTDAGDAGDTKPKTRMLKATCACGHIIRASRKVLDATVIRCETCGEPFDTEDA